MVKVRKDLTGMVFGKLTVLRQADDYIKPSGQHHAQWLCQCACNLNNQIVVRASDLKNEKIKSCGCLRKEIASKNNGHKVKYNLMELNLEDEHGLYGIGYCSNTNNKFYFDMDDYEKIKSYCWREGVSKNYHYVCARIKGTKQTIRLHNLIFGKHCDHIDRNPLNNRKYNLRDATIAENSRNRSKRTNNSSGVIGVSWHKRKQKWSAEITKDYKKIYLGTFINKYDAIKSRLEAEVKYYGEFAPQRHLFEEYGITTIQN